MGTLAIVLALAIGAGWQAYRNLNEDVIDQIPEVPGQNLIRSSLEGK